MTPAAKLALGACVVIGVTGYMAYVGASTSWKYYVTTDECLSDAARLAGSRLRVSGRIAKGSLEVSAERTEASFDLQGQTGRLRVVCSGPLPDNLEEEMEVVVEGRCESHGMIRGDKVLTRCASKYETGRPVDALPREPVSTSKGGP